MRLFVIILALLLVIMLGDRSPTKPDSIKPCIAPPENTVIGPPTICKPGEPCRTLKERS